MKKRSLKLLTLALCLQGLPGLIHAQTSSPTLEATAVRGIYVSIPDPSIITGVSSGGVPTFSVPRINSLMSQYNVSGFTLAFPTSNYEYLRQIYYMDCSSGNNLGQALRQGFPQYFPYYEQKVNGGPLGAYYPNDLPDHWPCRPDSLMRFLGAPDAWGITKGDPSVITGITDTHLDMANPDLAGQIAVLGHNSYSPSDGHGTLVTGLVAAATDNSIGYTSIGFKCRVEFNDGIGDNNAMLLLAQKGRPVLNGSWYNDLSPNLDLTSRYLAQGIYNEIYENGTLTCFAAGNGAGQGGPDNFLYPASYDHVFCTSGEGWEQMRNGTNTFNVKGCHNYDLTGSASGTQHHNSRVDLLAPSIRVPGLAYSSSDPTLHYQWDGGWGTSFASPLVASTAALIKSYNSCFTPYQIEYILKTSANHTILSYPENAIYAGKIGSGGLQAGEALKLVDVTRTGHVTCNDANIQTMTIDGIEINTICVPGGTSNGVFPQFTPIIKNGVAPYTYVWEAAPGNTTTLDAYNVAQPKIMTSTGANVAYYRLTVYDASPVQKVANRIVKIKLKTGGWDLAMRDSYTDMLDEPNQMTTVNASDWQIWQSPDVWNRQHQDGSTTHENPEFFNVNPNYAYVKVRNVGCVQAPGNAVVRLYWTKASTGEYWKDDWDSTTHVASAPGFGGPGHIVKGGDEITYGSPLAIGPLDPGQSTILNHTWYPPQPESFAGSPHTVDVCLLARIEDSHGFTIAENLNQTVKYNVINNNNIITRNLIVTNLNPLNKVISHQIDIANAETIRKTFNLQLINDRIISPYLSGDFSSVGYVRVYLGDLYDRWMDGGHRGNVAGEDRATRSVLFEGTTTMELDNITLESHERIPVTLEFNLNNNPDIPENTFNIHLRQFAANADGISANDVYGNVSFEINTSPNSDGALKQPSKTGIGQVVANSGRFTIFPNPAAGFIKVSNLSKADVAASINITNTLGQIITSVDATVLRVAEPKSIDISSLAPGVYMINIVTSGNKSDHFSFVKE